MTVGQLRQTMSAKELAYWRAYDTLDPIGAYRQDLQTALLVKAQGAAGELEDFVLFDPDPTTAEARAAAKQHARLDAEADSLLTFIGAKLEHQRHKGIKQLDCQSDLTHN